MTEIKYSQWNSLESFINYKNLFKMDNKKLI